MGRTRLARTSISELKKRIILAQERKLKITQYLQELWEKYQTGKISRDFYVETAHRHSDGKTLKEWVDYYDDYISECEILIKKHKKDVLKNQIRVLFFSSILILILFGISLYTQPRFVGFLIQEPVPVSEIVTEANATITTTQQQAILGQPVKWTKTISLDEPTKTKVRLPIEATNISVNKISGLYSEEINKEETLLKQEDSSPSLTQPSVDEFPEEPLPSSEKQEAGFSITGLVTAEDVSVETGEPLISRFFRNLGRITGQTILEPDEKLEIEITEDSATEYEIEYETPAPSVSFEEITERGKRIQITGPETIHYENVLSFTNLDESLNIVNPSTIRIYWREDDSFISPQSIQDTDNNGIYDYIEWIAPSLSSQTFDIIVITKAEHLDSNREFISDIYEEVRELDNIWSETIPNQDYVRVVFEIPLTSNKDITIYPRVVSGTPKIEVYEFNKNDLIATFDSLTSNQYNKVFLTNLQGTQDTFDLRILGGVVEFDHIIDPFVNVTGGFNLTGIEQENDDGTLGDITTCLTDSDTATSCITIDDVGGNNNDILLKVNRSTDPTTLTDLQLRLFIPSESGGNEIGIYAYSDFNSVNITDVITTSITNGGGTDTFNLSQFLTNGTFGESGVYSIRVAAQGNNAFQVAEVEVEETVSGGGETITLTLDDFYGLNSSKGVVDEFNTSNLEEIEYMELNFSISADNNIYSWHLNFTANGTGSGGGTACSLGNKQSSVCYNYSNPTATKWIQFINGTDTDTFNGTMGVQGDRIDVIQTGSGTAINLSFRIDEHYNPNVFKHYDALFDFSNVKWQNGTDQRITNDTMLRIEINESLIPLDADQYKLDFRVNYTSIPPDPHLNAFACNSTYSNEDPEAYGGCSLVTQKYPSELQDDGTKFRGIFTKNLITDIGDLKYIILLTHETNTTKYYFIKTYNATASGYTTDWEFSNDSGSNWYNLGDGYETELNINWFYDGADPTAFIYNLWVNTTTGGTQTLEGNITWNINATNNYPPVVSLVNPDHNSLITTPYNITFNVADPNNDNTNVSLFLYQGGTLNETIATGMNQSNKSYYWTTSVISGDYNLTLQACELGTSDLFCTNENHTITIDNDGPVLSNENANETQINQNEYFCLNITATDVLSSVDIVIAEVYNTTDWVNYTMFDTDSGCDGVALDGIFGVDIQGDTVGLWNYSKVYANDTLGNANSYDFADLTINVISAGDSEQPKWQFPSVNDSTPLPNRAVRHNVNWTDDTTLQFAILEVNGTGGSCSTSENVSETTISGGSSWANLTWLVPNACEGKAIGWKQWANDTTNNGNLTDTQVYVVQNVAPTTSFGTNPVDNYNSSISSVTFDLKVSDNLNVDALRLYGNWTGTWGINQTNMTAVNDSYWNITVNNIPEGKGHVWAAWGNDTLGNSNFTGTNRTFTVDLTSPNIQFVSPTKASGNYSQNYTEVNVTASDSLTGLDTITIFLYNSTGLVQENTSSTSPLFVNFTSLPNENYYFNATVNDTSGNTNQTETRYATIGPVQFARPDSDISNDGNWDAARSYTDIDEIIPSDADNIRTNLNSVGMREIGLSDITDPQTSSGHIVRARHNNFAGSGTLAVSLMQGATTIASWNVTFVPDIWTTEFFTLNSTQADSITDYNDLRFQFWGGDSSGRVAVSWAELEVPSAGGDSESPKWQDNSTNSTEAGELINHSVFWTDDTALSGFIFSFDNGTGGFTNDSFVSFPASGYSNVLKKVNQTVSSTIRWIVYANDSANNWNNTDTFTYDTTVNNPPKWFDNSTNSTKAGETVEHRVRWTNTALAGYIFSFDNGTGSFVNDTFVSFTGAQNWSNVTKIANSTVDSTIQWRVYANDSLNQWNATDIFSYDTTTGIKFDAASNSGTTGGASTYTWPHTVSGTDRILIVGVSIRDVAVTVSNITYLKGGTNTSLIQIRTDGRTSLAYSEIWYMVAPDTGTSNIEVVLSGPPSRSLSGAVSLTGIDQSNPIDAHNGSTASASSSEVNVTTTVDNAWIVDVLALRTGISETVATDSNQTERWNVLDGANGLRGAGSTKGPNTPAGIFAMNWTFSASNGFAHSIVALTPTGAANNPPTIDWVEAITDLTPNESWTNTTTFNFTATDLDGYTNINVSSAQGFFQRGAETTRSDLSCINWSQSGDDVNFTCTIAMWYFDENAAWTVNVTVRDNNQATGTNSSTTITYLPLVAMVISPTALSWPEINLPDTDTGANENITINNTGNVVNQNINVTAYNLQGNETLTQYIFAENFTVKNASQGCTGTPMVNATTTNVTSAILQRGNNTLNYNNATSGQEQIFFCLKGVPQDISSQEYSSIAYGAWEIRILLVAVIPRLRKKKKQKQKSREKRIEDDKLFKALDLIFDELKEEYSLNKKEMIEIMVEKLKKKYKITKREITDIVKVRELSIPITIFSKKLGALESIVKYMKENLNMSYREIAKELGRNERTIWTSYKKSKEKQKESLDIKETDILLLTSIFKNKKLTTLESVIVYLKEKGIKYSEKAELLDRDQRNIWTIYSRARKKVEQ